MRILILILLALAQALPAGAQQLFGSRDDPAEYNGLAWWETATVVDASAGFSLIGPQWRSFGRLTVNAKRSELGLKIDAGARAGVYGAYSDDFDDWRDALRVLDHARYTPRNSRTYVRLGPLDRARLGTGHLMNFFSSDTAWDERSPGVEATVGNSAMQIETVTEDVTAFKLTGARLSLRPFAALDRSALGTLWLSGTGILDRSTVGPEGNDVRAWAVDARMTAFTSGNFVFQPFASFARLEDAGQGLLVGADLLNDNFVDLARLHIRIALHYNSTGFLPGWFGSFYTVNSYRSDILASGGSDAILAGLPLDRVFRDNSVWTEFRIHFFERFELWYQFLRHHGVQSLSEYHLRLYMHTEPFMLAIGQDRAGLEGFLSLFGSDDNQNVLRFQMEYRVSGPVWIRADARYTYSRAFTTPEGRARYVAQRRFEPVLGLRFEF